MYNNALNLSAINYSLLMKTFTFLFLVFSISVFDVSSGYSRNLPQKEVPEVQKLDRAPNLFQCENMFYSGQPNLETLEWLKTQGVDLIINLRSEDENKDFSESSFDEKDIASKLEMRYISIPVNGYSSYTPENLAKFAEAMNGDYNKVLIHCGSAGRVTTFMMGYLVEYKNYDLSDAIKFGKQIKFSFPLENLLSKEIVWDTK